MTGSERGMICVVEGCDNYAAGPPVVFDDVQVLLCDEHRQSFDADPLGWDGEVDPTHTRVVRMWQREGIGSAS